MCVHKGRCRPGHLFGTRRSESWISGLAHAWASYRTEIEDFIDAGEGRVVVLTRDYACPTGADAELSFMGAPVWTVRDGKVARIEFYWNRTEGLAAAGLGE